MKRFDQKLSLGLATFLTSFKVFATYAFAQPAAWSGSCTGSGSGLSGAEDVATIQGLGCLIANVLSVAVTMIGLLAFVMFIAASFRYLVAGGNSKNVELAKGTMTYAIAGIVVALSAFIILNLITQFTGVDVSRFVIPEATTTP
ncbi:hypothetical protein KJZ63_03835 [Patescibacteria group bacterium]|nr:hypothetical protein [Patescibacteria group bacterium]